MQIPTLGHLFFEPFTVRLSDRLWGTDSALKGTTVLWQGWAQKSVMVGTVAALLINFYVTIETCLGCLGSKKRDS